MSEQLAKLDERTRQALESMMYSIFDNAISNAFTRGYEKGRDDAAKVAVDYQRIWRNNIVAAEQIESAIRALSAEEKSIG